ncbi:MAG: hypothetical protein JO128_24895 [Alphaproteobacteria bacterium]|nr:hypothetical protein [Alphaproteobacteria bacterium]
MTDTREPQGAALRLHEFVERYTTWMKEVSASARDDATLAATLTDLMKNRLVDDLDAFIELELRLRAFERRVPEVPSQLRLVGTGV